MDKPILAAMLSIAGPYMSDAEKLMLEKANPIGISIFGRNIENKTQLQKLIIDIKTVIGRDDVLIAVDQEGGRVRRLREPDFRSYAAQYELGLIEGKFGQESAKETVKNHALLIGKDLNEVGINLNYAPSLDVAYEDTSPVLKSRCFGCDEHKIAQYGKIIIEAYQNCGICPCIKHMPGHGRANSDPHFNTPVLNYSLKELEKDFYPFIQNNNAPAGMTAHIIIPEIDNKQPITQSKVGIDKIIRGIIGFDGFLISDAIDMHALHGSLTEKCHKSLEAGCDAVCYCMGDEEELHEVIANCSFLTDKSMIRFARIKNIIKNRCDIPNCEKIAHDYQQMMGKIEKYDDHYDATEVLHKMKKLKN